MTVEKNTHADNFVPEQKIVNNVDRSNNCGDMNSFMGLAILLMLLLLIIFMASISVRNRDIFIVFVILAFVLLIFMLAMHHNSTKVNKIEK